jgi:hypothetical protein
LYHYFARPISENGKAFHLSVSRFIPDIMRVAHIFSKFADACTDFHPNLQQNLTL